MPRSIAIGVLFFAGCVPWAVCFYLAAVGRVPWLVPLIGFAMYGLVFYGGVRLSGLLLRKPGARQDCQPDVGRQMRQP